MHPLVCFHRIVPIKLFKIISEFNIATLIYIDLQQPCVCKFMCMFSRYQLIQLLFCQMWSHVQTSKQYHLYSTIFVKNWSSSLHLSDVRANTFYSCLITLLTYQHLFTYTNRQTAVYKVQINQQKGIANQKANQINIMMKKDQ